MKVSKLRGCSPFVRRGRTGSPEHTHIQPRRDDFVKRYPDNAVYGIKSESFPFPILCCASNIFCTRIQ